MKRTPRITPLLFATVVALSSASAQQASRVYTTADYDRAVRLLAPRVGTLVTAAPSRRPGSPTIACGIAPARANRRLRPRRSGEEARASSATRRASNCPGVPSTADADAGAAGGGRWRSRRSRRWRRWTRRRGGQCRDVARRNARPRSFATGISGCATSPAVRRSSSRPTARRTSATRPTTPAGRAATAPILLWSPDSKKIATSQQDERNVGDMFLVETKVGHPTLKAWKYPLPGDSRRRDAASRDHRRRRRHASSASSCRPSSIARRLGDNITMNDYNWSPDGSKLALVSTSRDHKNAIFRVADAATGAVRTVFEETVPTHFESRTGWRVLWPTNEVDLVFAARRLGPALSLRSEHRQGEAPDHDRRGPGDADRAHR